MRSILYLLPVAALTMSVAVAILPSRAADDPAGAAHDRPAVGQTVGLVSLPKPATKVISGVVASVDERNDTIKIRQSPQMTEELKVRDGLLFNAVRYGEPVEVTVENINGAKTIVGLVKR
jgi:Cu/Ag efflux protein CusF